MNYKLIFLLSLFGLLMAVGTVYLIPSKPELIIWLFIFVVSAYLIAKYASGKYFLHGFLISILNSFWVTAVHIVLFDDYMLNHPVRAVKAAHVTFASPQLMMLILGPIIGILFGLVLGLFAYIASKFIKNGNLNH